MVHPSLSECLPHSSYKILKISFTSFDYSTNEDQQGKRKGVHFAYLVLCFEECLQDTIIATQELVSQLHLDVVVANFN